MSQLLVSSSASFTSAPEAAHGSRFIGTVSIFRYGAGQDGVMRTLGKFMTGSGATFGFFMGVGSVIRTDADPEAYKMYMQAQRRPIIWRAQSAWKREA
ncbi:hypothetical protein Golomagni_07999 [Golovinomyces magnicellulatus]|nr:hypothetical protein Golomagni_07999 [Golovinomyces magnicellulatus]